MTNLHSINLPTHSATLGRFDDSALLNEPRKTTRPINNTHKNHSIANKTFRFHLFASASSLTKEFSLGPKDELTKNVIASMYKGSAKQREVKVKQFSHVLNFLAQNQAIALSNIPRTDTVKITTKDKQNGSAIARTLTNFPFATGKDKGLTAILFDFDFDDDNPAITVEQALQNLEEIIPETASAAKWIIYSSSSYIKQSSTGKFLNENKGFHVYMWIHNSHLMKTLGKKIMNAAWRTGHGYIRISKSGAMLERCLVDCAVFSPERLIFETKPIMGKDLTRDAPAPQYIDGGVLNLRTSFGKKISDTDKAAGDKLINTEKERLADKAATIKAAYESEKVKELCRKNKDMTEADALDTIRSRVSRIITPNDVLEFDHFGEVSAKEVMADFKKYDKQTLRDPIEPEKGRGRAIFYANNGVKPIIHSMLEDGINYTFQAEKMVSSGGGGGSGAVEIDYFFVSPINKFYNKASHCLLSTHALNQKEDGRPPPSGGDPLVANKCFKAYGGACVDGMTWEPCCFDKEPTEIITYSGKQLVNTYRSPPKLEPDDDDSKIPLFLELIAHIIPNPEERNFYLDHQAYTMQRPDEKINWQILYMGATRIGKDMSLKPLAWYFGDMYKDIDPDDTEANKWGDIQAKRKVLVYQEVFRPKDRAFTNSLKTKAASTGSGFVTFNIKGGSQIEQANVLSVYAMSNFKEAMHLEPDDERWLVLSSMKVKPKTKEFYTKLYHWLTDEGGNELVAKWLLARELSHFTPGRLPLHTKAKKALVEDSHSDIYRKIESTLQNKKGTFSKDIAVFDLTMLKDYLEAVTRRRLNGSLLSMELEQMGVKPAKKRARSKMDGVDRKKIVYINPNFQGIKPKAPKELWDAYAAAEIKNRDHVGAAKYGL